MIMDLAIIIPAYKVDYIDQTFESILKQTNQNFHLYVFDDASPYPVREHYEKYFANKKNCSYFRFEKNLGGKNLAEHWERCVHKTKEDWFWLFSDDDIMSSNCIDSILSIINKTTSDVLRTTLCSFKDNDLRSSVKLNFEDNLDSFEFFEKLVLGKIDARMPEFIFRRAKFELVHGYVKFDLAWRSDNATVMLMTYPNFIQTLSDCSVFWRSSGVNISKIKDSTILARKNNSTIAFFSWVDRFYNCNNVKYGLSNMKLLKVYASWMEYPNSEFSFKQRYSDLRKMPNTANFMNKIYLAYWTFLNFMRFLKHFILH